VSAHQYPRTRFLAGNGSVDSCETRIRNFRNIQIDAVGVGLASAVASFLPVNRPLSLQGVQDFVVVLKLDSAGGYQWRAYYGNNSNEGQGIAEDLDSARIQEIVS